MLASDVFKTLHYSSTVMYKASAKKFGHGRDLTVSKLYDTWCKQHPERFVKQDNDQEYLRLLKIKEEAMKTTAEKPSVSSAESPAVRHAEPAMHKPTQGEQERDSAIFFAVKAVMELVKSPFRTAFYPHDLEDILPEGIIAKAIDMGQEPGASFSKDNLKAAADALMDMVECSADRTTVVMEGLLGV